MFSGSHKPKIVRLAIFLFVVAALQLPVLAQVTSPKEEFGFNVGDDYHLVNYKQLLAYWKKLATESDRMTLVEIGKTAEGRPMVMAIITSPENHTRLDRYKEISRSLSLAKDLSDGQARALAAEGRAVVWIDGGLHATEVVGGQQLIEMVWQMVSREDAETLRFLDDVILLAVPANPDGLDLVADWYMRIDEPEKRSTRGIPRLYQKYVGHDNNRDFYMNTQPESKSISRQLYREWHPQILYNHHQSGPAGTVLFAPPFRDPFNFLFDSLIPVGLELVGAAMHGRFVAEDKPGATMRSGASYSTWWNGGLRTTAYFHNAIGILTEIIGNPTPTEIPFVPRRVLPNFDYPYPVTPQRWHFRQSIDYSITANRAILDVASKHREDFLYNRYLMGKHSIEKGSQDSWTILPAMITEVEAAVAAEREGAQQTGGGRGGFGRGAPTKFYEQLFDKEKRDPRGYILPADQPDFLTATKLVNTLLESGVAVHRATAGFTAGGKSYPKGSYVILTAQAFRPHLLSLFEPQDHPDDIPYPGGPPNPPYDSAGWTLAFQMGVVFDRVLDGFEGPFEEIPDVIAPPPASFDAKANPAGWLLDHRVNDSFVAMNRIFKAKGEVYWLEDEVVSKGKTYPVGTMYIPRQASLVPVLEKLAKETGLHFEGVGQAPAVRSLKIRPQRIGLWDSYGGSMGAGWARWILEQFEFPFERVFAPALDTGNLKSRFDVLIFVGGGIPRYTAGGGQQSMGFSRGGGGTPQDVPDEYKDQVGRVSVETTLPKLREFIEQGGTIITIGSSTSLGFHFGLPIGDHLVEKTSEGEERPLQRDTYYVPGSVLEVQVDNTHPLAYGVGTTADIFFNRSPVFRLYPEAGLKGVRPVAWFGDKNPLRSGWTWGEQYLAQGVEVLDAEIGKGKLVLCGPEVLFRAQPHGTFKFVFNGIYYGGATPVNLR